MGRDTNCVIVAFSCYAESNNFREPWNKGLELFQLKKATKWISDVRTMRVVKLEDQDWASQDWAKRFVAAGAKYLAVVVPTDILGQMAVQRAASQADQTGLETNYFDSLEAAKTWLSSKRAGVITL